MVRFGCCLPLGAFAQQTSDVVEQLRLGLDALHHNAYDFAELGVGAVAGMSNEEFERAKEIVESSSIKVYAFNSFIPGNISLTGPNVSMMEAEEYVDKAMTRISAIGASYIVFGSGAARKVPDGFSKEMALEQLASFLNMCERYALRYNLTIAIEPLNKGETNIINSVNEGLDLAKRVQRPHIKLLADLYHMLLENESADIIYKAHDYLVHTHIANRDRLYPGAAERDGEDIKPFFKALKEVGYNGGVSVECRFNDFISESIRSLAYIKSLWQLA